MKFTDGTPLDAAAVAYNFDQFENTDLNGTAKVSMDPYYKSAEAIDPTHVAIHLNKPYPQFLTLITQGYFGIQSPTALKTRVEGGELREADRLRRLHRRAVEERPGGHLQEEPELHLVAGDRQAQGPGVRRRDRAGSSSPTVSRATPSLTTGQSDVIYEVPTVQLEGRAVAGSATRSATSRPGKPVSFYLNTKAGVFTDKLVRQAFAYGADRKGAVEAGFHGVIPYEGNPSVSQSTPGYNEDAAKAYAYDPDKANAAARRGRLDRRTPTASAPRTASR